MNEQITYCPHCGNKTSHEILFEAQSTETAYYTHNPSETIDYACFFYLVKCKTCAGISLYSQPHFADVGDLGSADLCYPNIQRPREEVPQAITDVYNEALKVEQISSMAFAILLRKSLELLCKDQKAQGRNLKAQLENLGKMGVIPETLAKMGDALRILGNLGAHDTNYKLDIPDIAAMKDFMIAMLEYVYVGPAKITKLQESIAKKRIAAGSTSSHKTNGNNPT